MTNLPLNSLDIFPVGYPAGGNLSWAHTPHTEQRAPVNRRLNARINEDSPTEIMFRNDFSARRRGGIHAAIDILGARGLPVFAACAGRVVDSWRSRGESHDGAGTSERGGNYVMIQDSEDRYHYYTHMMEEPGVEPGQEVRAGQRLGRLGHSGSLAIGTHPHLHYQVSNRNEYGALMRDGAINPFSELLRLATACGGAYQVRAIKGFAANTRWLIIGRESYRAGGPGRQE